MPNDFDSIKNLIPTNLNAYFYKNLLTYLTEFEAVIFLDSCNSLPHRLLKSKFIKNLDSNQKQLYLLAQDMLNNKHVNFIVPNLVNKSIKTLFSEEFIDNERNMSLNKTELFIVRHNSKFHYLTWSMVIVSIVLFAISLGELENLDEQATISLGLGTILSYLLAIAVNKLNEESLSKIELKKIFQQQLSLLSNKYTELNLNNRDYVPEIKVVEADENKLDMPLRPMLFQNHNTKMRTSETNDTRETYKILSLNCNKP